MPVGRLGVKQRVAASETIELSSQARRAATLLLTLLMTLFMAMAGSAADIVLPPLSRSAPPSDFVRMSGNRFILARSSELCDFNLAEKQLTCVSQGGRVHSLARVVIGGKEAVLFLV